MTCILCGCPDSIIISQSVPQETVNSIGRTEISFTVESKTNVRYGKDGLYHCAVCGGSFTFQEATTRTKKLCDPQTKLDVLGEKE
jgi:hypothetical protein